MDKNILNKSRCLYISLMENIYIYIFIKKIIYFYFEKVRVFLEIIMKNKILKQIFKNVL